MSSPLQSFGDWGKAECNDIVLRKEAWVRWAEPPVERNREKKKKKDLQLLRDTGVLHDYRVQRSSRSHQSWYHFLSLYFSIILMGEKREKRIQKSTIWKKCVKPSKKWQMRTSWACLEKESALAIIAAVRSSSSPSFCPLSSRAIRARARSPTTPDAAPFMPSILPGPGMCWARLREALPAVVSPTTKDIRESCLMYQQVPTIPKINKIDNVDGRICVKSQGWGKKRVNIWTYRDPLCPETEPHHQKGLWRNLCSEPLASPQGWITHWASPEDNQTISTGLSMFISFKKKKQKKETRLKC